MLILSVAAETLGGGERIEVEVVVEVILIDDLEVLLALNAVLGPSHCLATQDRQRS